MFFLTNRRKEFSLSLSRTANTFRRSAYFAAVSSSSRVDCNQSNMVMHLQGSYLVMQKQYTKGNCRIDPRSNTQADKLKYLGSAVAVGSHVHDSASESQATQEHKGATSAQVLALRLREGAKSGWIGSR